jgi:ParB/RepB/Spo0J family partition protein
MRNDFALPGSDSPDKNAGNTSLSRKLKKEEFKMIGDPSKETNPPEKYDGKKCLDTAAEKLLGDIKKEEIVQIPVEKIMANRFQPRRYFKEESLASLAETIKEDGVQQPITVRKIEEENSPFLFELIAGERRLRASRIAGLKKIPAVIKEKSDREVKKLALLENLQREDLTYFETMISVVGLKEEYGSNKEVGAAVGLTRRSVEQYLKIHSELSTIPEVFALVEKKQSTLNRMNLKDTADIMAELRRYQKSDKRELERVIKKIKEKGLVVTVAQLLRKIEHRNTGNKSETYNMHSLDTIFKETDGRLLIRITLRKDALPSDEGLGKIHSAMNQLFQRIEELSKETMSESSI